MHLKLLLPALCLAAPSLAFAALSFKDTPGEHLDILRDGKPLARYQYAHDTSTRERREETCIEYTHQKTPTPPVTARPADGNAPKAAAPAVPLK